MNYNLIIVKCSNLNCIMSLNIFYLFKFKYKMFYLIINYRN